MSAPTHRNRHREGGEAFARHAPSPRISGQNTLPRKGPRPLEPQIVRPEPISTTAGERQSTRGTTVSSAIAQMASAASKEIPANDPQALLLHSSRKRPEGPLLADSLNAPLLAPTLAELDTAVGRSQPQFAPPRADCARDILRPETAQYGDGEIRMDSAIRCGRTHLEFSRSR